MKRINRDGPAILGGFRVPREGDLAGAEQALADGTIVIDTRPADVFATGHIPGTINIPMSKTFSTWAGWLVPYDVDIQIIADDATVVRRAVRELAMIGLDRVTAWYAPQIVADRRAAGRALGTVAKIDATTLATELPSGKVTVIDVRNRTEWEAGHLPHAMHIPIGYLPRRLAEIPRDRPIVVQCQGGARSAIATSVLQRLGVTGTRDLIGGFQAWERSGGAVER
jgi:hydroxyacylglutathione hydrolase